MCSFEFAFKYYVTIVKIVKHFFPYQLCREASVVVCSKQILKSFILKK